MALSSGAYFGSHSTLSQDARAGSAARVALLVWMGPLSGTSRTGFGGCAGLGEEPDRLGSLAGFGTVAAVELFEKGDEISAAFARAGLDDQFPPRPIKGADHRDLGGLAGSGDTQIGALLGPDMGEVGMRE